MTDVAALGRTFEQVGFPIGWIVQDGLYPVPQFCKANTTAAARGGDAHGNAAGENGSTTPAADRSFACAYPGWGPAILRFLAIIAGWLITALAIMLGAPFWFDVLNKFMVVRSTVKPKEKSPDEASEDRQTKHA